MAGVEEIHNYPFDPIIKFKQPGRSFSYKVIKEGVYPNKSSLAYTLPPNKYRIPDDYIVETTWGKSKNQCTVQCLINYSDDKPVFQIWFGKYFEYKVFSSKSTTDAANLFHKVCILNYFRHLLIFFFYFIQTNLRLFILSGIHLSKRN